jgi:phosphohistidine phosphatase
VANRISLYLVRHAVAAERGDAYPDDTKRPLTARGAGRFRRAVKGLATLEPRIDLVLTSSLVRARQTADILVNLLPSKPKVEETAALEPGASFEALKQALASRGPIAGIALVGHEPGIGELAARLLGTRSPIPFKKGAICLIEVETLPLVGAGTLVWFLPPRALRALA